MAYAQRALGDDLVLDPDDDSADDRMRASALTDEPSDSDPDPPRARQLATPDPAQRTHLPAPPDAPDPARPIPIRAHAHAKSAPEKGVRLPDPARSVPVFGPADPDQRGPFLLPPDDAAVSRSAYLAGIYPAQASRAATPAARPSLSDLPVSFGSFVQRANFGVPESPYHASEMAGRRRQIRMASGGAGSPADRARRVASSRSAHDVFRAQDGAGGGLAPGAPAALAAGSGRPHANSEPSPFYAPQGYAAEDLAPPPVLAPLARREASPTTSSAGSTASSPAALPPPAPATPPSALPPSSATTPERANGGAAASPTGAAGASAPSPDATPPPSTPRSPHVSHLTQALSLEKGAPSPTLSPAPDASSPTPPARRPPPRAPIIAEDTRLVVVMVGLPARGKTYISRKVARYVSWIGYESRIVNVGQYRRVMAEDGSGSQGTGIRQDASFFDPGNAAAAKVREEAAQRAMEDLVRWATGLESGCVAIFDATNTTAARRRHLHDYFRSVVDARGAPMQVLFVESVVTGEMGAAVVRRNVTEVKLSGPDYAGADPDLAMRDFLERIRQYEKVYQTMDESEGLPFVKIIDAGRMFHIHKPHGHIQTRISYFLMNLNIAPKSIYFTRHGESEFNVAGRIGGDAGLSGRGWTYARKLPEVVHRILPPETRLRVWTSSLVRTIQTASFLVPGAAAPPSPALGPQGAHAPVGPTPPPYFHQPPQLVSWKALDELDSGYSDGLTYEEIAEQFPAEYAERESDKFYFRYRGGESYADLCRRIEPVVMELERVGDDETVLIVGHQAVLRCVYAWFMGYAQDELPYLKVPLHCVIKLSPRAYGCQVESWQVDIPAVDTHRDTRGGTTW